MTPKEAAENLERFNRAQDGAQAALVLLAGATEAWPVHDSVLAALEAYVANVTVMVETSSELIGVVGPLAPKAS